MSQILKAGLCLIALTMVASLVQTGIATTQTEICGQHADIVAQLGLQYAERRKSVGLIGDEAMMEIFVSDHGSWTILTTDVKGATCIIAAGEVWDDVLAASAGQGV